MATKFDARQVISKDTLDQIANSSGLELDDLLRYINSELTSPLRINASSTPNLTVTVENITVTNSQTSRRRTIQPIEDQIPAFTSGTLVFPATSGGTITVTPGVDQTLTLASGQYLKVLVGIDAAGDLIVDLGTAAASEALATLPTSSSGRPIGYIVVHNSGGTIQNISNSAIVQFAGGGAGGAGGGVVQWNIDETTGVTGATITFDKTFSYNKGAFFFRNGVEMRKVASFTVGAGNYSDEYMEVDAGNSSTQITLHSSFPAVSDDVFEMRFLANTFDGVGLAEKTLQVARGYGDGSQVANCTITQVSNKTRVTLDSGFNFILDYNTGKTLGDVTVRVNGQDIERKVTGKNDNIGNIIFEEVSSNVIDIYEIIAGPSTQVLPNTTQIEVVKASYFVAELDAITSDLIPLTDNTYDLGATGLRWKDLYLGPDTIHIGDNSSSEGQIKWDSATQKLQFKHLPADSWQDLGSGAGEFNYCENPDAETNTAGWSTYADAAAAPVDGNSGSPTLTFIRSTSSPLRDTASFLLTPGTLGNGAAYGFTIDRADLARIIKVSFDYELGTYTSFTDGDISVFVISASDSGFTTNLEVQQLAPYKVLKAVAQETWSGVFQSHASNLYYRVCIHQVTSASGYTLKLDNVKVGPGSLVQGAPVGDWTEFTPSVSNVTLGTGGTIKGKYQRVGDTADVWVIIQLGSSGASVTGQIIINHKTGILTGDLSKLPTNYAGGSLPTVGVASGNTAGNYYIGAAIAVPDTVGFDVRVTNHSSGFIWDASRPGTWTNSNYLSLRYKVPVLGWSSTVEMSNDTDTRIVAAIYGTTTTVSSGNPLIFTSKVVDTHAAYNTSTGRYTCPIPGIYRVSFLLSSGGGTNKDYVVYKNGSTYRNIARTGTDTNGWAGGSMLVEAKAGDILDVRPNGTVGGAATDWINFERLSGPAQIAASEFVGARYTQGASSQSITGATVCNYTVKDYDTHGSVTTGVGTWKFTAPIAGYYKTDLAVFYDSSSLTAGNTYENFLRKNGTNLACIGRYMVEASTTQFVRLQGGTEVYLNSGDYIDVTISAPGTKTTYAANPTESAQYNYITISKINK